MVTSARIDLCLGRASRRRRASRGGTRRPPQRRRGGGEGLPLSTSQSSLDLSSHSLLHTLTCTSALPPCATAALPPRPAPHLQAEPLALSSSSPYSPRGTATARHGTLRRPSLELYRHGQAQGGLFAAPIWLCVSSPRSSSPRPADSLIRVAPPADPIYELDSDSTSTCSIDCDSDDDSDLFADAVEEQPAPREPLVVPEEVLEMVFEATQRWIDDSETLKSAALVCRWWSMPARRMCVSSLSP